MRIHNRFHGVFSLLLVVILLVGMIPSAFADGEGTAMSINDLMKKFDSRVQRPRRSSLLDEPETMTVTSKYGNLIYALAKPGNGEKLFDVDDGSTVIVYAKQSGYALGLVKGTSIGGWMNEKLLSADESGEIASKAAERKDLMKAFDRRVQKPKSTAMLDEPEKMVVTSKYGNLIYVLDKPNGNTIFEIADGTPVIVYARQSGYALAMDENSSVGGWMNERLLSFDEFGELAAKAEEIRDVMKKFDSRVQKPKAASFLDEPERRVIESTYGKLIYVLAKPGEGRLFEADDGEEVIVYARESGYALAIVDGTSIGGWMNEKYLVDYD